MEQKKKSSPKEILIIVVVVVLSFGLTVAGIVYLASSFVGGTDKLRDAAAVMDEKKPTPQETPTEGEVVRFSFDNETDNSSAPVDKPATTATTTPAPKPAAPVATQSTPPAQPKPVAAQPKPQAKPAEQKPVAQKPTTTVASVSTKPLKGVYQIQMFATQNVDNANAEILKYKAIFPDSTIIRVDLGEKGIWYRARCCSTDSAQEANEFKAQVAAKFKVSPIVVKTE